MNEFEVRKANLEQLLEDASKFNRGFPTTLALDGDAVSKARAVDQLAQRARAMANVLEVIADRCDDLSDFVLEQE